MTEQDGGGAAAVDGGGDGQDKADYEQLVGKVGHGLDVAGGLAAALEHLQRRQADG